MAKEFCEMKEKGIYYLRNYLNNVERRIITVFCIFTFFIATAAAMVYEANAIQDSEIRGDHVTYNYGKLSYLSAGSASGPVENRRVLVKWELPSNISGSLIRSANMNFAVERHEITGGATYQLHILNHNWVEGTGTGSATNDGTTWQTYDGINVWPGGAGAMGNILSEPIASTYIQYVASGGGIWTGVLLQFDVTEIIRLWAEGIENDGVLLTQNPPIAGSIRIFSSDQSTSPKPTLHIEYEPAGCEPYLKADINQDCYVNMKDMYVLAADWLNSGPNMLGDIGADNNVNLADFVIFADEWLACSDPDVIECGSNLMHIEGIVGNEDNLNCEGGWHAEFTVTVTDRKKQPVSGVTVNCLFDGIHTGSGSALTNESGEAIVNTDCSPNGGLTTIYVNKIESSGKFYDPQLNATTSSIAIGGPHLQGKIIEFGWDWPDSNYLHDNIENMEQTAFDGILVDATTNSDERLSGLNGTRYWFDKYLSLDIDDFSEMVATINDTSFTRFTDNFIHVMMSIDSSLITWYDSESYWNTMLIKCETLGKICNNANNFAGIFLDTEQYSAGHGGVPWLFDYGYYSNYGSYEQVKAKVRSRARDISQALCRYCPDIIIALPGAYEIAADRVNSHSEAVGYTVPLQNTYQALYPAFIDGLLEGLSTQAQIININQAGYPYICSNKFSVKKDYCQQAMIDYATVDASKLKQGFSTWIDYSSDFEWPLSLDIINFNNNHFTPNNFRKAIYNGLSVGESGYHWVNCESGAHWWTPGYAESGSDAGPDYRLALALSKYASVGDCPDGINDMNMPNPASSYPGWDDTSTFGDLWTSYDELYNLPNQWNFYQDTQDAGRYDDLYGFTQIKHTGWWTTINIREWWERQGYSYNGVGIYRAEFTLDSATLTKDLYLVFGAVANDAMVYMNGRYLTRNTTGNRFLVPISSVARLGTNSVAVRVFNKEGPGGIWKSVKLIAHK